MSYWHSTYHSSSGAPCREAGEEAESVRTARSAAKPLSGYRVLVVEDEFIIALDLRSTLEDAGAVVVGPAATLEEALSLAKRADISAATLDLRLAHESVAPVARLLTKRGIPFLFYSGQPATDPIFAEWPRSRSLKKPADSSEVIEAVSEIASVQH